MLMIVDIAALLWSFIRIFADFRGAFMQQVLPSECFRFWVIRKESWDCLGAAFWIATKPFALDSGFHRLLRCVARQG